MAITYKVLGQSNPAATTATTLYTVPSTTSAVCSTLVVCNQASTAATFRIAVRPAGATLSAEHYAAYDTSIPANETITFTIGLTLATTDVVTVYASTNTVSFHLYGSEYT